MKKTNFCDKLRYSFDNLMSKGTLSLILLLAAITAGIIVVAGIVAACLNGGEFGNAFEMMWVSLMHTLDAGTIAGDDTIFALCKTLDSADKMKDSINSILRK